MKVNQIRVSRNVNFFADRMMRKFNLTAVKDLTAPVVMYGMYNSDDYSFFDTYKPFKIVLWRGTDALVMNKAKADIILRGKDCRHYASSIDVRVSLKRFGIEAKVLPITSTPTDIECVPRGDSVYCYVGSKSSLMQKKYKVNILHRLARVLPYKFIYATLNQYSYEELLGVYKKCFIGIRLLDHDGMSNSILEMGLMGRRVISNSGLPYTIKWRKTEDIKDSIIRQYKARTQDNNYIHDAYLKLIDIGDKWLEV